MELCVPSKRNLLDTSSVAQSLDGNRLKGSLHIPDADYMEPSLSAQGGKVMSAAAVTCRYIVDPVALNRLVSGKIDLHYYGRRVPHIPLAEYKIGRGFLFPHEHNLECACRFYGTMRCIDRHNGAPCPGQRQRLHLGKMNVANGKRWLARIAAHVLAHGSRGADKCQNGDYGCRCAIQTCNID